MKKTALYIFAGIGVFLLICIILRPLLNVTGSTMYGSSAPTSFARAEYDGAPGAMTTAQKPAALPADNVIRRMIIRNANITLQVNNIAKALEEMTRLAETSGGYVVRSNIVQDPTSRSNSSAEISIRVPAEGLNNALKQLKSMAYQVIQESISGEDITQQYVDLESQLQNLQQSKKQLEKIMLGATNTEDVLKVQERLADTQGQIDLLSGQIKYFKESVAFSLITINLTMNPTIQDKAQSKWKISETFKSSYLDLMNGLRSFTYNVIQIVVYYLPLLLLWAAFSFVIYWIGKTIYKIFRPR